MKEKTHKIKCRWCRIVYEVNECRTIKIKGREGYIEYDICDECYQGLKNFVI